MQPIKGSFRFKFVVNAKHPNFVVVKWVPSKTDSNDLAVQNYFESILVDDQEALESCHAILPTNIFESIPDDIFLKETNLVAKFWTKEMDRDKLLRVCLLQGNHYSCGRMCNNILL